MVCGGNGGGAESEGEKLKGGKEEKIYEGERNFLR